MAVLTAQDIPVDGFEPTFAAAESGGDEFPVGAGIFVVVKNASAVSSKTVTARVPVAAGGVVEIEKTVAVSSELWLPAPVRNLAPHTSPSVERDADANATLAYSAVTDVTVAAVRAP